MRGHEQIIKLRTAGYRPKWVNVFDFPVKIDPPRFIEDFGIMDVDVTGDDLALIDFRFLVELPVTVFGNDRPRCGKIAAACKKAGAEFVSALSGDSLAILKDGKWLTF